MADFVKGMFGGLKPAAASGDGDFADFAGAPAAAPPASAPSRASNLGTSFMIGGGAEAATMAGRPYTRWYRVWERTSRADFQQEMIIAPFILAIIVLHVWGRRKNRRIARNWARAHAGPLADEFAVVGFAERPVATPQQVETEGLAAVMAGLDARVDPDELLREKTAQEYHAYATGRVNTAFVDVRVHLLKRYNPLTWFLEWVVSLMFDASKAPAERVDAVAYAFDGREKDLVPVASQAEQDALEGTAKRLASAYDGFVFAVVHKDEMRALRDDRYDLSLTTTKDNARLPPWATVMSESAEVTDALLTPALADAVAAAGDGVFRSLVVSDQPVDKPTTLKEAVPRKRLALSMRIPSGAASSPAAFDKSAALFAAFLRLPDQLAGHARFRPEVMRKIRATRDAEIDKIKKRDEEERADDRKFEADKKKKTDRDAKLKGLSADEQRKYLDKEREKDQRKQQKKMTKRG